MIVELLSTLGVGGSITTGAVLLLVALYLRRAVVLGGGVAAMASSAATYGLLLAVTAGVAIMLGWIDPHPGVVFDHLRSAASTAWTWGTGPVRTGWEWLIGVLG